MILKFNEGFANLEKSYEFYVDKNALIVIYVDYKITIVLKNKAFAIDVMHAIYKSILNNKRIIDISDWTKGKAS